jgi:hypothetical protein
MSKKILELARDQRDEVAEEMGGDEWEDEDEEEDMAESWVCVCELGLCW